MEAPIPSVDNSTGRDFWIASASAIWLLLKFVDMLLASDACFDWKLDVRRDLENLKCTINDGFLDTPATRLFHVLVDIVIRGVADGGAAAFAEVSCFSIISILG